MALNEEEKRRQAELNLMMGRTPVVESDELSPEEQSRLDRLSAKFNFSSEPQELQEPQELIETDAPLTEKEEIRLMQLSMKHGFIDSPDFAKKANKPEKIREEPKPQEINIFENGMPIDVQSPGTGSNLAGQEQGIQISPDAAQPADLGQIQEPSIDQGLLDGATIDGGPPLQQQQPLTAEQGFDPTAQEQLPQRTTDVFGQEQQDVTTALEKPTVHIPAIGGTEFLKEIMKMQSLEGPTGAAVSVFTPEVFLPTIMAIIGDSQDIADVTLQHVPGASERLDENGNRIVIINGKDFRPDDTLKMVGDVAMFTPATILPGLIRKGAKVGLVAGLKYFGTKAGVGAAGAGLTSVTGEEIRRVSGSKQGFDLRQIALETSVGGAAEFVAPLAALVGKGFVGVSKFVKNPAKVIVKLQETPATKVDLKFMDDIIIDRTESLRNATLAIENRNALALQQGVDPSTIPLDIATATGDLELLRARNYLLSVGDATSRSIGKQLERSDEGIFNLTTEYLNRIGSASSAGSPEVATVAAATRIFNTAETIFREATSEAFKAAKANGVHADVSGVMNKILRLKKTELAHGKNTAEERILNQSLKLIKPNKVNIMTTSPTGAKSTTMVGGKRVSGLKVDPVTGLPETKFGIGETPTLFYNDPGELHAVYKALNNMISKGVRRSAKNEVRLMIEIKNDLKKVIDDAMSGMGDANKLYREASITMENMEKGVIGKLMRISQDDEKKVSDIVFNKNLRTDIFRKVRGFIKGVDPDAWDDLTALQIQKQLSNLKKNDASGLYSALAGSPAENIRIKNAMTSNADLAAGRTPPNVKTYQDIVELTRTAMFGTKSIPIGSSKLAGSRFQGMFIEGQRAVINFFTRRNSETYHKAIGDILTTPESDWFGQLQRLVNKAKAKPAEIPAVMKSMTQLIDNYLEIDSEEDRRGFIPTLR